MKKKFKESLAMGVAALSLTVVADVPTIVNIINFVRGTEPRYPNRDLVEPLRREIELNTCYHLPNTILLQYDALLRDDIVSMAKSADHELTEYGIWLEMCRQLIERCGIRWRGRPGWDWEWFVNPGFLPAYTPEERERICDEVFRLFKERFGNYPKSVGCWLLDAHSMDYLQRRYGIEAFAICREQTATDAYGLHGGYATGAYYPSRRNALSPAVDMANAVKTPVFRMLTADPIYNFAATPNAVVGPVTNRLWNSCTLEPALASGVEHSLADWYFRVYTGSLRLGLSYMQIGQENSFGWRSIARGLPYQIGRIAALREEGKILVQTLGASGRWFAEHFRENTPQTLTAFEDWAGNGYQSIWYSCRRYRMNLLFGRRRLAFRDIHVFDDAFEEKYLKTPCRKWHCAYTTLPVVDGFDCAGDGRSGMADFGGEFTTLSAETPDAMTLVVRADRADGSCLTLRFCENGIMIDFGLSAEMNWSTAQLRFSASDAFAADLDFPPGYIEMAFSGFRYAIGYDGDLKPAHTGWTLHPIRGKAALLFDVGNRTE